VGEGEKRGRKRGERERKRKERAAVFSLRAACCLSFPFSPLNQVVFHPFLPLSFQMLEREREIYGERKRKRENVSRRGRRKGERESLSGFFEKR
jgi:hypothetical protein